MYYPGETCQEIFKALEKRKNFELKTNAEIEGYDIDQKTKRVTHVNLSNGDKIPCDLVILSTGGHTRSHVWKHFRCILPMMCGQGYAIDVKTDNKFSTQNGVNFLLFDRPYSYSQYKEGHQRMACCVDLGCFEEPFVDQKRIDFIKKSLREDYELSEEELAKKFIFH
jgi:glycine/D-amino acid oxidase-like deaminating enzyme